MYAEIGHFALILALVAAVLQSVIPIWGMRAENAAAMRFADNAAQVQFLGVAIAFAMLTRAYVVSDFSLVNVAMNSHSAKPLLYKVTGVWANHEGSMLLWVLILTLFGVLILTFALSLIGTFLVRSGILSSVHAFANDPERGVFILLILCIAIGGALTLFAARTNRLTEGGYFASVSHEGGLL